MTEPAPHQPHAHWSRGASTLAGRERERAIVADLLQVAAAGSPGVLLISGEPGIGKTRLLDELAAMARAAGAAVLRGGSSEAAGMPPYLPFLEALGAYITTVDADRLRAAIGDLGGVLATILPELHGRLPDLAPGYPLPPEQTRLRLFEAVAALLAAAAAEAPAVVILDDLQWADAATLDLLVYLARRAAAARLLIAGGFRSGDVDRNSPFQRALIELNRLRALTVLPLTPLDEAALATIAASSLGEPPPVPLLRALVRQSEGNPFFAEELLRHWLTTGTLTPTPRGWSLGETGPPGPSTIAGAIRQRFAAIDNETLDLLRTAAILGRRFDTALLARVAGADEETIDATLREVSRTGLLHIAADGFSFAHDKVRETLYEEVSAVRRRRLHGFIGHALEQPGDDDAAALAARAYHFARSGDRERGIAYAERAAIHALAASAPADAHPHLQTALDLLSPGDQRRGRLLLALGDALTLAGMESAAVARFADAERWFRDRSDLSAAARAAHQRGTALWRLERADEARTAFEAALTAIDGDHSPLWIAVKVDLGSLLATSLHQGAAGIAHAREALAAAERSGDPRLAAVACRAVGNLLVREDAIAEGRPLLDRALELAITNDDPAEAAECCACLLVARYWSGDIRGIRAAALQQIAYAERCHDLYQLRHVHSWLAACRLHEGDWPGCQQEIARAREIADRLGGLEPRAFTLLMESNAWYWYGDPARALAPYEEGIAIYRSLNEAAALWHLGQHALLLSEAGETERARQIADETESRLATLPSRGVVALEALIPLGLMAAMTGDRERAARVAKGLRPFSGRLAGYLVDRVLGMLATTLGDWAAANRHLAAAETMTRAAGSPVERAHTLAARADLELARGGAGAAARAAEWSRQAAATWQALGWDHLAARERGRLSRPPARAALPAGLSEREAEVLRLVAAGRSNRQIAGSLFISEKTVANHLTSVFTKIGVDNRVAATAFALRHGLTDEPDTRE